MTSADDNQMKPWPLAGYAPGHYMNYCHQCGGEFKGDKRAVHCLECAASLVNTRLSAAPPSDGTLREALIAIRDWQLRDYDNNPNVPEDFKGSPFDYLRKMANDALKAAAPKAPTATPADGVPAGFVSVPIEPTQKMLLVGSAIMPKPKNVWSAMLSVAPMPPTAPPVDGTLREAIEYALKCTPTIRYLPAVPSATIVYDCGDPWEILRNALHTVPIAEDRHAGNRAAFEVGENAAKNGPTPELERVVRLAMENEDAAMQAAKVKLIDTIISMYHTTRLSETPASSHILSKQVVKRAFAELIDAARS